MPMIIFKALIDNIETSIIIDYRWIIFLIICDVCNLILMKELPSCTIVKIDKDKRIQRIVEKPEDCKDLGDLAVSSVYVFKKEIFDSLEKIRHLERGISHMLKRGAKGTGVIWTGGWMDIGRPWDVLKANRFVLSNIFSEKPRYLSPSVSYKSEKQFSEPYYISDDVEIDYGAVIKGGCFLDAGCRVGTNALVREYSYVGRNAIAGYSTEIKNSLILNDSNLGHIAYVGDSIIGSSCEIGAGVITSNFRFDEKTIRVRVKNRVIDSGLYKLGAIIGDKVKIGVNSSIYPGCKIGSNTWIGPGVIVRKDVEKDRYVSLDLKYTLRHQKNINTNS